MYMSLLYTACMKKPWNFMHIYIITFFVNFLLIELRRDKDYSKFFKITESLIKNPVLKEQAKKFLYDGK